MADENLLIGTADARVELPQFLQGTDRSHTPYINTQQMQGGSQGVTRSAGGAVSKELRFGRMHQDDMWRIDNLVKGVYGNGPIYFFDPFVANLAPQAWSIPYLQPGDPVSGYDRTARATVIDTPANPIGLPVHGIDVARDSGVDQSIGFSFVLPDDKDLAVAIYGKSVSGNISFTLDWHNGVETMLKLAPATRAVDSIVPNNGSDFATLSISGSGEAEIYGMTLIAVPRYIGSVETVLARYGNVFRAGDGMAGARVTDQKTGWTEYALGVPWGMAPTSITLTECEWADN